MPTVYKVAIVFALIICGLWLLLVFTGDNFVPALFVSLLSIAVIFETVFIGQWFKWNTLALVLFLIFVVITMAELAAIAYILDSCGIYPVFETVQSFFS